MKLDVLNIEGGKTGSKVDLSDDVFGIEPNDHAIYLAVKLYRNNQRQGTHKSKERGEVKGSTRKIKRQKGTGTARAGDIKNPLFRGGGRVFGPEPRDYGFKINKKEKELAKRSALSYKAKDKHITVVEDFEMETPRTADYVNILENIGVSDKKSLLVTTPGNKNVWLSGRNLPKAKVVSVNNINVYDVLNADQLILSVGAVESLNNGDKK